MKPFSSSTAILSGEGTIVKSESVNQRIVPHRVRNMFHALRRPSEEQTFFTEDNKGNEGLPF